MRPGIYFPLPMDPYSNMTLAMHTSGIPSRANQPSATFSGMDARSRSIACGPWTR